MGVKERETLSYLKTMGEKLKAFLVEIREERWGAAETLGEWSCIGAIPKGEGTMVLHCLEGAVGCHFPCYIYGQ